MGVQTDDVARPTLWEKAFMRTADWRKDELRLVTFWVVTAFSLSMGGLFGLCGLRGLPCIVAYFAGAVFVPSIYWASFLDVDEEDFGGKMELLNDSIGSGAAMFLISWIGMYTAIHG
ncbi:hypothetical protein GGF46_000496 [Coemansia sp. RSA 552]|nr:hypothetical protein GGF46_000496 [Coemansia sp. RSA 552]